MAISVVGGSSIAAAASSTQTVTYTSTAGNLLVVTVSTVSATVKSVTDTAGNGYSKVVSAANGTAANAEVWVSYPNAKSCTSITVTLSGSAKAAVCVEEYSGVKGIGCTATTGSGNFNTASATGSSALTSATLAITDTGGYVVGATTCASTGTQTSNTGNFRQTAKTSGGSASSNVSGALIDNTGAASLTVKSTISASETWVAAVVELLDVAINGAAVLQGTGTQIAPSTTSGTIQLPSAPTAGNAIIVVVQTQNGSGPMPPTLSTITDNNSNTYSTAVSRTDTTVFMYGGMFVATGVSVSPNSNPTITVTLTGSPASNWQIVVMEVSGLASTPVDQTNNAGGTSTSITTGAITTTQASEILVAAFLNDIGNTTLINPSGWLFTNAFDNTAATQTYLAVKPVAAIQTSVSATATAAGAFDEVGLIASFKISTGGSASTTASDSVSFSESLSRGMSLARTLSDAGTFSEGLARAIASRRTLSDTISLSEAFRLGIGRTAVDTFTLSETLGLIRALHVSVSDTSSFGEALARGIGRTASDTVSFSETLARQVALTRAVSTALTLSETLARASSASRAASDTESFSESNQTHKGIARTATDTASFSETLRKGIGRTATDTLSLGEALSRYTASARSITDALSFSESNTAHKGVSRSAADTESFSDTLSRITGTHVTASDALSPSDLANRLTRSNVTAADTLTFSEVISRLLALHVVLTDSLAFSDSATNPAAVVANDLIAANLAVIIGMLADQTMVTAALQATTSQAIQYMNADGMPDGEPALTASQTAATEALNADTTQVKPYANADQLTTTQEFVADDLENHPLGSS